MVAHFFNFVTGEAEAGEYKFEGSLVNIVSSRPARGKGPSESYVNQSFSGQQGSSSTYYHSQWLEFQF